MSAPGSPNLILHLINLSQATSLQAHGKVWVAHASFSICGKAHESAQRLLGLCQQDREEQRLQLPLICVIRCPLGTDLLKSSTGG